MKITKIILAGLLACTALAISACNDADIIKTPLYYGAPDYQTVDITIKTSDLFNQAPELQAHVLNFATWIKHSQQPYSYYQVTCDNIRHKLTEYSTVEHIQNGAVVTGQGISYGGIFPIMYEYQGGNGKGASYYYKYRLTTINNMQGHFFPLRVGTEFFFDYLDQTKASENYPGNHGDMEHDGIMYYRTVGVLPSYNYGTRCHVPGPIYVIDVYKTIGPFGTLQPFSRYYFSTKLGWYVRAEFYAHGHVSSHFIGVYKLISWH